MYVSGLLIEMGLVGSLRVVVFYLGLGVKVVGGI